MKKWVDLKVGDAVYILEVYRNGSIYGYKEIKIEGFQDLGFAISVYYDNPEYKNAEEDNKYLSFDLYKNEFQNSKLETQDYNYKNYYADKDAVLIELKKYQDELNSKQEVLNNIMKNFELEEIGELDYVMIDGDKFATIVHAYQDGNTFEVEIIYFAENVVETVTKDRITMMIKRHEK